MYRVRNVIIVCAGVGDACKMFSNVYLYVCNQEREFRRATRCSQPHGSFQGAARPKCTATQGLERLGSEFRIWLHVSSVRAFRHSWLESVDGF